MYPQVYKHKPTQIFRIFCAHVFECGNLQTKFLNENFEIEFEITKNLPK